MNAVILAAGRSSRLRPLTDSLPKCLLPVGGVAILERAVTTLAAVGVHRIVIVTGYLEHQLRAAVLAWKPQCEVRFVYNDRWEATNNCYSLLLGAEELDGEPFLLVDGDVVFERGVIEAVLASRYPNRFALRVAHDLGQEEMKVELDDDMRLRVIGKDLPPERAAGEAVGIWLFSSGARAIVASLEQRVRARGLCDEWYEASFQQAIDEGLAVHAVEVSGYVSEIDTAADLAAVERAVGEQLATWG